MTGWIPGILLEDEFIASDQKDAVDVCISVSIDAI